MAQQLPRCVQQASWMRVWSTVGGGGMSMRGICSLTACRATATPIRGFVSSRSQSLAILCRSSSSSSLSSSYRSSRTLGGSSGEPSRLAIPKIGRNFAEGFVVSGRRGLRASQFPLLSPFLTRGFSSSAEASAITDGFVKESLLKDAEEKSGAALADVVQGETEKALHTEVEKELDKAVEETVGAPLEVLAALVDTEVEKELDKAVEETVGAPLEVLAALVEKEVDEVTEREALVAEIKSKELELAELRSALRLVEIKHGVEVESIASDSVSLGAPGFPEVDTFAEQGAASQVSAALRESSDDDFVNAPSAIDIPSAEVLSSDRSSQVENAGSDSLGHPWPEWIQFLRQLEEGGFFVNEEKAVVDLGGSTHDDLGLIKRACLNFSRERDDIFLHYSRKDLEVIARFGCPCTDRKVVNAGKRLRDFLAIDEISVCKPCALRPSCERRDFKASPDHVSGTPEVIRLLSQYAFEVSPYAKEGLQIPSTVEAACVNLIKETIALGAVPRDPRLPKIERKGEIADTGKPDRRERESKRKFRDADVEMKPGDWKCEKCEYVNFARNRSCRECDAFRPVPEMRPGDWRCPECNFVNFSRNQECHDCKVEKPAGLGYESSYDTGSRYSRGDPDDRGSRFDRDRRSEVRSFDRGSERGSFGRSESRDNDRGSDRYDSWGGGDRETGRSRERGGLKRRSASDEPRGGRRSNFEEWKPDLKKRGNSDKDEHKDRRSVLDTIDDDDSEDDIDDFELDSDDDDISDVEAFEDEEFEDMRPAASASRGRGDTGRSEVRGRSVGRGEDRGRSWEDDRSFRSERSDRGSRGGGSGGRGRGGGRGGRGDRGGDRTSSRDSRPSSYDRSDRDSRPASYERSYERSDRDSGRSYGRSDRDSSRPSRGRGGGRGGGGRGRGRGRY